jgi:hypothetical protein
MGAKALGHVFKAPRAPIRVAGEGPPEQFVLPEPPGARHAIRYGVVPAVVKEKGAFFAAEPLRQATVEVDDAITVDFDRIPGRDRLRAPWTRWLRCHFSAPIVIPHRDDEGEARSEPDSPGSRRPERQP